MISDRVAITPDARAQYPAPFYDPFVTVQLFPLRAQPPMRGLERLYPNRVKIALAETMARGKIDS